MSDLVTILERMPDDSSIQIFKTRIMNSIHYRAHITYRLKTLAQADNLISNPEHIVPILSEDLNRTIKDALEKMINQEQAHE